MVTIIVPQKYHQKRLDKFLKDTFRSLSSNTLYKAIRTKNIRINGTKIIGNCIISENDKIEIYIKDELLYGASNKLDIVYEDENLIIVNKAYNILSEGSDDSQQPSLLDMAKNYLEQKNEHSAELSLCHRLDRNTQGLIMLAKNKEALDVIIQKFKNKEIKKYYLCWVIGCPKQKQAELKHYLLKDAKAKQVKIFNYFKQGAREIITRYKVLEERDGIALLEVEIITGKTHQIRAHLAYIGHPILGDQKYGRVDINKKYKAWHQQLQAYKLFFNFKSETHLDYLKGKIFDINLNINQK